MGSQEGDVSTKEDGFKCEEKVETEKRASMRNRVETRKAQIYMKQYGSQTIRVNQGINSQVSRQWWR